MFEVRGLFPVNRNVYPSGSALATYCVPIVLPAPGWFSTITA